MKRYFPFVSLILIVVGTEIALAFFLDRRDEARVQTLMATEREKDAALEQALADVQKKVGSASDKVTAVELSQQELQNRAAVHQKSQDELLTAAVAEATPAVVSIVISKDVPQLVVTYENPFGDDPLFQDVGIRVPVYRQKGTKLVKTGAGTGFLISKDGYIVTNKHVVSDDQAEYMVLLSNGAQKPAKVVYRDAADDIAIVKIGGGPFSTLSLGDSKGLKLGQAVIAIGNALGEYNNSVSVGIISGLDRTIDAAGEGTSEQLKGVIQTDAGINPGNSGGPLLDMDGHVVGVNVATVIGSQNISFSIPADVVAGILKQRIPAPTSGT